MTNEIATQICGTCANFMPTQMMCLEWRQPVDRNQTCNRWVSDTGADVDTGDPMLIVSIEDAEKEAKRIEDEAHTEKKARRNSPDDVLRLLVDEQLNQAEISRRLGIAYGTVSSHINTALLKGEIVRVSHGKYQWAKDVAGDDRSGKKEGVATVSEDKVREIVKQVVEEALESWRDQLTKLRRDVDALELDVQELRTKQTPQQSDVAELALRILAAERGLIA